MKMLKPAEWTVLCHIVDGLKDAQIAEQMGIALKTEQTYVHLILKKLCVGSRLQAALLVVEANETEEGKLYD